MNKNGKGLNRAAAVIAKILEVFHWVGVGLMAAGLIAYLINEKFIKYFMDLGNGEFGIAGYSVNIFNSSGEIMPAVFIPVLILGIITLGLMAMICRNTYLIFKTSEGKTKFSEGETPFQRSNVRMLREIGIFAIAVPITAFIFDLIIKLIAGIDNVESSISLMGIALGIVVLCLSQFFAYGVQLQSDSDGLI